MGIAEWLMVVSIACLFGFFVLRPIINDRLRPAVTPHAPRPLAAAEPI